MGIMLMRSAQIKAKWSDSQPASNTHQNTLQVLLYFKV